MANDDESLIGALLSLRPADLVELLVVVVFVASILMVAIAIAGRLQ
jgi:hypothetical protein